MTQISSAEALPWFTCFEQSSEIALRLFCFPYAGGGAHMFRGWDAGLPKGVAVCPIHLPGRGRRLREMPYNQMEPLVSSIARALIPQLEQPFAFFGHSMGAMISFELTRLLRKEYNIEPLHLFLSGCRALHIPGDSKVSHNLSDAEFIDEVYRMGGTDKAILENADILKLVLPMLRADFELVETYRYFPSPPLSCPITAFGGAKDAEVIYDQVEAWRGHTTGAFSSHLISGDHFFPLKSQVQLLQILAHKLTETIHSLKECRF